MEEDIRILRRFIKDFKECKRYCKEFTSNVTSITREEYQALENLIKGYRNSENIMENAVKENLELKKYIRELEEDNEGLKLDRRNLLRGIERITQTTPLNMRTETNYSINIDNNTIPKSKIKEILENWKNQSDYYGSTMAKDLQELMEDK